MTPWRFQGAAFQSGRMSDRSGKLRAYLAGAAAGDAVAGAAAAAPAVDGVAAPPAGGEGGCAAAAWNAATAYNGGAVVSFNGRQYTAKWWTQGEQPDLNVGDGKPWLIAGYIVLVSAVSLVSVAFLGDRTGKDLVDVDQLAGRPGVAVLT